MTALSVDGAPGIPMHHELLSAGARALALLQHPPMHTCPHTWLQRWYSFFEYRQDLKLPLVFRAQVGSEATDPIFCADNAIYMLQIRPGASCFAVLDVLSICGQRERVLMGLAAGCSCALLLLPTADPFSPWHGLSRCARIGRVGAF